MAKAKVMAVLLVIFLVYQPFSAAAQALQENTNKVKEQAEKKNGLSETQTLGPIYVTLVKPLPDFPINLSKKEFKQELQNRLALQIRFSLAVQILALALGFLSLVVISVKRRTSAFDHRRLNALILFG